MKHNIALILAGIGVGAACMTSWRLAHAGIKGSYPVIVNTTARHAEGSLGSARNSSDSTQYLYCAIDYSLIGGVATLICGARDSSGNTVSCTYSTSDLQLLATLNPPGAATFSTFQDNVMLAQMASMSSDSYVSFDASSSGACTHVYIENGSVEVPKAP
ncbi:MAG TPA: hypothetical protein VGM44_12935 [Polyangiaceae bacterium]